MARIALSLAAFLAVILTAAAFLGPRIASGGEDPIIVTGSGVAQVAQTVDIPVQAQNIPEPGVGNWSLRIEYSETFIEFVGDDMGECEATAPNADFQGCIEAQPGQVVIAGSSTVGNAGNFSFGEITFLCHGPGQEPLDLEVTFLEDLNMTPVATTAVDGSVECSSEAGPTATATATSADPTETPSPTETPDEPTNTPGPEAETPTATPTLEEEPETPTATATDDTPPGQIGASVIGPLAIAIDVSGWEITIHQGSGCSGPVAASGTTGDLGTYTSPDLAPGEYSVELTERPSFRTEAPCQGVELSPDEFAIVVFHVDPPGDLNKDNAVDSRDALLILQFDAGLIDSLQNADRADINADGAIDSRDASVLLQFDAGIIGVLTPIVIPA